VAALGWLYAILASFWVHLFQRGIVKNGERVYSGYRIGLWKIYWRLPVPVAIGVTLLSFVPILVVILWDGWPVTLILAIMTGVILLLWIALSPGSIVAISGVGPDSDSPVGASKMHRDIPASILKLVTFGLLPALGIGALLSLLIIRITG
jgi:hypothetical protein